VKKEVFLISIYRPTSLKKQKQKNPTNQPRSTTLFSGLDGTNDPTTSSKFQPKRELNEPTIQVLPS